ncbi:hypothetical protein M0R45_036833 [Rubus argutus]|uniref:Prion protein n=1 Tax=Rubus argutus TaxID=59490 RepID=A0AAW1VZ26_RUBAR
MSYYGAYGYWSPTQEQYGYWPPNHGDINHGGSGGNADSFGYRAYEYWPPTHRAYDYWPPTHGPYGYWPPTSGNVNHSGSGGNANQNEPESGLETNAGYIPGLEHRPTGEMNHQGVDLTFPICKPGLQRR